MKGAVSRRRDRKAECPCGDKNRLQFLGLPAPQEHQSNVIQAQQNLRSNQKQQPEGGREEFR